MSNFRDELQGLLNRYSRENTSNTPDYVLADYLIDCLKALDVAIHKREQWYGRDHTGPCSVVVNVPQEIGQG
jgi:hypothetical protein